jgi:uncharacterized protein (DUF2062 family)
MKERFKRLKCCVIISTNSGGDQLLQLIQQVLAFTDDIIVIQRIEAKEQGLKDAVKLQHQASCPAQRTNASGFQYALKQGYQHALWIENVPSVEVAATLHTFLEELESNPGTLLIGVAGQKQAMHIQQDSVVDKAAKAYFWFKTGVRLEVLRSHYRLYPIHTMQEIQFRSGEAGFEREVLTKAAWHGIPLKNIYLESSAASSKKLSLGRSLRNFRQLGLLNTYLVSLALFYYIPLRLLKVISRENIKAFINKNFFDKSEPIHTKALSIAFGVFMALSPFIGFQLLLGIPLAHWMKLNKALFVTAANISIPPFIPFLMWGSFKVGAVFVSNAKNDIFVSGEITAQALKDNFLQYGVGALVLAALFGLLSGLIAYTWLNIARRRRIAVEIASVDRW